jgi:RimJ/RimL family protein N-acetyltransferase
MKDLSIIRDLPELSDGRLSVRPFEPRDAPAVRDACDDPDVAHWIYGLPTPYLQDDAGEFIAESRSRLLIGDRARLAVCDARSGDLLGSVSLDLQPELGIAETGYWVKREARRRGVALGAARIAARLAFEELGVGRLELMTYPGNTASQALAHKLGLRHEGRLRGYLPAEPGKGREGRVVPSSDGSLPPRDDQELFALLAEEWLATG